MDVIITFNKQIIKNKFKHPYTKIEFVEKDLKVSRITATNYLNTLSDDGILTKK
jgi:Mn-dependent DtxR family transcriptional regulator